MCHRVHNSAAITSCVTLYLFFPLWLLLLLCCDKKSKKIRCSINRRYNFLMPNFSRAFHFLKSVPYVHYFQTLAHSRCSMCVLGESSDYKLLTVLREHKGLVIKTAICDSWINESCHFVLTTAPGKEVGWVLLFLFYREQHTRALERF